MGRNNRARRAAKAKQRQARARAGGPQGCARYEGGYPAAPFGTPGGSAPPRQESPEERFERYLMEALGLIDLGLDMSLRVAGHALAEVATPGSYGSRRLSGLLEDHVKLAWQRGWQPADVHRLAERETDGLTRGLIRDAMFAHLATFSRSTVPPRWFSQLDDIEATQWWPDSHGHVDASLSAPDGDTDAVVIALLQATRFLQQLPVLTPLGPLPGEYREQHGRPRREDADERILTRVRRMLAKAESTTFEAEAEAFTEAAQALMARHSIDAAMLAEHDGTARDGTLGVRVGIDRPYEKPKAMLLNAVAEANRCRTVWSKELGFSTLVGFPSDVHATETLFTSLLVQSTRAMAVQGTRSGGHGSRTRSFRSAFLTSFAHRIGERLTAVTKQQTDEAAAEIGSSNSGRQLVHVLADRSDEVRAETERLFPETVQVKGATSVDAEGWHAGRRAADMAHLGSDPALAPMPETRPGETLF